MRKALAFAAVAALACMLLLSGCAGRGTLSSDIDDQTGAYKVTASDAGKDSAVATSGGVIIEEGQILVVSPDLTKGSLQVRLVAGVDDVVLNEKVSGRVLSTFDIAPGEYAIGVTCNENGTTGALVIAPVNATEFEQQNQDLDAALKSSGVSK